MVAHVYDPSTGEIEAVDKEIKGFLSFMSSKPAWATGDLAQHNNQK